MSHPQIIEQANRIARKLEEEVYYGLNLRIGLSQRAEVGVLDAIEELLDRIKADRQTTTSASSE